jgi:hypothetical protein
VTQALPPQTLEQSVTIYTIFQNFCFHRWQRSRTTFGYLVQIVTSAAFPFQLPRLTAEKSPNHAQIPQINKSSSLVDQSICQNTVKVVRLVIFAARLNSALTSLFHGTGPGKITKTWDTCGGDAATSHRYL